MPLVFDADGTVRFQENEQLSSAKYRVDYTKTPHQIDIFEFDNPEVAPKDAVLVGIFDFDADGHLKINLSKDEKKNDRPQNFGDGGEIAVRTSRAPGGSEAEASIVGAWALQKSMREVYVFTADGTVRTLFEVDGIDPSKAEHRYTIDDSKTPMQLNFYFGEINDDPSFRGIIEFASDNRMRLEGHWTKNEAERPKTFGAEAYVFSRAPKDGR
jgi:uncharacterized protein (TIGR03067 family)